MQLKDTKKRILLNSGHWDDPHTAFIDDTGANVGHLIEQVECVKIRNALVPILQKSGFEVLTVPDELDLKKSIAWVNERTGGLNEGLAVDIHLNALSDTSARGTEVFHGTSDTSKAIAQTIVDAVANGMGIQNRGAKPDTATAVGSLGWIRNTKCWATLVEVCFITNESDMGILRAEGGYEKAAKAIADGICKAFGTEAVETPVTGDLTKWRVKLQLAAIQKAVDEIEKLLG